MNSPFVYPTPWYPAQLLRFRHERANCEISNHFTGPTTRHCHYSGGGAGGTCADRHIAGHYAQCAFHSGKTCRRARRNPCTTGRLDRGGSLSALYWQHQRRRPAGLARQSGVGYHHRQQRYQLRQLDRAQYCSRTGRTRRLLSRGADCQHPQCSTIVRCSGCSIPCGRGFPRSCNLVCGLEFYGRPYL